jgi:hypothetical protein
MLAEAGLRLGGGAMHSSRQAPVDKSSDGDAVLEEKLWLFCFRIYPVGSPALFQSSASKSMDIGAATRGCALLSSNRRLRACIMRSHRMGSVDLEDIIYEPRPYAVSKELVVFDN